MKRSISAVLVTASSLGLAPFASGCVEERPSAKVSSAAVDRCIEAMQSMAAHGELASHTAELGRACADTFKERACSDAFREVDNAPIEARNVTAATRCRDAYCPLLPSPKPGLCTNAPATATELGASWQQFVEVVHRRDLTPRDAARLRAAQEEAGRALLRGGRTP